MMGFGNNVQGFSSYGDMMTGNVRAGVSNTGAPTIRGGGGQGNSGAPAPFFNNKVVKPIRGGGGKRLSAIANAMTGGGQ